MTEPLAAPADPETGTYPSRIIMLDVDGNLTDDPAQAASGEVIETLPDGTERVTAFRA